MGGRILLWFSAFVFIGYGLVGIAAPGVPARFAGLVMSNGDAYAEISSMYGGLQTGLGVFCLLATLRPAFYRGGLAVLVLGIGGVGLTRLLGGVMASDPVTFYTWGATAYELATAALAALAWRVDLVQERLRNSTPAA
jgi:hypothetical protein